MPDKKTPGLSNDQPTHYKRPILSLIPGDHTTSHFHETTQAFCNAILAILKSLYKAKPPENTRRELYGAAMHMLDLKQFDHLLPIYEIIDNIEKYIAALTQKNTQPVQACQITLKIIGNLLVCSDSLSHFPKFEPDDPTEEIQGLLFDALIGQLEKISYSISQSSEPSHINPKCLELIDRFQEKMLRFGRVASHPIAKKDENLFIDLNNMIPYEGVQQALIDVSRKFHPSLN